MDQDIKVLIAEDEPIIANKIKGLIEELGWTTTVVHNLNDLYSALSSEKDLYHAIVLDRMMSNTDSADHVFTIRTQNPNIKIFILSAIDSSIEKAKLIDNGADDYLAKPFESIEFKARIRSLIRNSRAISYHSVSYTISNTSIDQIQRTVTVNGKILNLTVKEFLLINTLGANVGKIYAKNQLIETVWGFSLENETNVVESTVNSLRRKLESAGSLIKIKNTRFVGYWIEI